jgi:hypothetical protein
LERSLQLDQLDLGLPQLRWVLPGQIGPQEVATFAPPSFMSNASRTRLIDDNF